MSVPPEQGRERHNPWPHLGHGLYIIAYHLVAWLVWRSHGWDAAFVALGTGLLVDLVWTLALSVKKRRPKGKNP
jgi:hypothetical protein